MVIRTPKKIDNPFEIDDSALLPTSWVARKYIEYLYQGWDFIFKAPRLMSKWRTETKYYLNERVFWNKILEDDIILGARFGNTTRHGMLDVDIQGYYHPTKDKNAIRRLIKAYKDIGINKPIFMQSSDSGGIHIYFFLPKAFNSFDVACALKRVARETGFRVEPGILEIFPNTKSYSEDKIVLHNGHRLPLQEGSYILSEDFEIISNSFTDLAELMEESAQAVDLEKFTEAVENAREWYKAYKRRELGIIKPSNTAQEWEKEAKLTIAEGWTGFGQTNRIILEVGKYFRVFKGLSGEKLIVAMVVTVESCPGYKEFCRHQHEIWTRCREWAKIIEPYWVPLYQYPKRNCTYAEMFEMGRTIAGSRTNAMREENATERIKNVVRHIIETLGGLPKKVGDRIKLIQKTSKELYNIKFGENTLRKEQNIGLWHPKHQKTENIQEEEIEGIDSVENQCEEQGEHSNTTVVVDVHAEEILEETEEHTTEKIQPEPLTDKGYKDLPQTGNVARQKEEDQKSLKPLLDKEQSTLHQTPPLMKGNGAGFIALYPTVETPLFSARILALEDLPDNDRSLDKILNSKLTSLDIETYAEDPEKYKHDGLHPWYGKIRLIQIGLENEVFVIDLGSREKVCGNGKINNHNLINLLTQQLQNPDLRVVGHNIHFDLRFLATQLGIRNAKNIVCTQIGLQILYGDANTSNPIFDGGYSLENAVKRLLGVTLDKTNQDSDWGGNLTRSHYEYAFNDAQYSLKLYQKLLSIYHDRNHQLYQESLINIWELENKVIPATIEVELTGMPLDLNILQAQRRELEIIQSDLITQWQNLCPNISYTQCGKLQAYLNSKYHLTLDSLTKTTLAPYHELPEVKLRRKLQALKQKLDTLKRFETSAHVDGRIRTLYKTLTGFGRFSCGGGNLLKKRNDLPNLQSVEQKSDPILSEYNLPNVRHCIKPNQPDRVMAVFDFPGSHGRIAADLANDIHAIAANNNPDIDNHSKVAEFIAWAQGYNWSWDYIAKVRKDKNHPDYKLAKSFRDTAKSSYFGWLNGAGAKRIQAQIASSTGITPSLDDCKAAISGCKKLYPQIQKYRKQLMKHLLETGIEINGKLCSINKIPDGSHIILPFVPSNYKRNVLEPSYCQNLACIWSRIEATAVKSAFVEVTELAQKHPEWHLNVINIVHDEIDIEVDRVFAEVAITAVNNIIGDCFQKQLKYVKDGRERDWTKLVVDSWADK